MKDNKYPYPCTRCPKLDTCPRPCADYRKWFKEEWRSVTQPFKALAIMRKIKKEGRKK